MAQPGEGRRQPAGVPVDDAGELGMDAADTAPETLPPADRPGPTTDASVPAVEPHSAAASAELEELILPPSIQSPPPLAADTTLAPDERLRIREHLGAEGRVNCYAAAWRDDAGQEVAVEVREAPADHAALVREAEVLTDVRYAMLPRLVASFEHDRRRYLVVERIEAGETLEAALGRGMDAESAASVALQLAQALRRLHQAGWALVGLSPADVVLGQPLRVTRLGSAVRIGEAPAEALHVPGYGAPELAQRAPASGKEDVYTLGAILFHALSRQPLPETGAELGALPVLIQVPGGPQLVAPALAAADERVDLETFYRSLLAFKQRLGQTALALEVASATSVGLNPTRLTNEDSCGYATWTQAGAEGASFRALLCVCDGMGGMEAGEVASGTALRAIMDGSAGATDGGTEGRSDGGTEKPENASPMLPRFNVPTLDPVALIRQAAPAVHAAGQGRQMGTTATVAVVRDGELTLGHVGDTRAYLLRDGELTQLTRDHSLVEAMVTSGVLTREEARGHPDSNKVLRSLGSQRELPERYVDDLAAGYGQPTLRLRPGDWLLLCSDGVWGSVPDEQIRAVLAEAMDPPRAARALVEAALRAGAPDNAAAVTARCVELPAR